MAMPVRRRRRGSDNLLAVWPERCFSCSLGDVFSAPAYFMKVLAADNQAGAVSDEEPFETLLKNSEDPGYAC